MAHKTFDVESSNSKGQKIILFLISPLLGFGSALNRMNTRSSFVIFFLFSVLFGLCFITADSKGENYTLDSAAYRYRFEQYRYFNDTDFLDFINEFKNQERQRSRDLYVVTVAFLTSRISDNYHVFFAFLAIVMAAFQLLSFKFLVRENAFKNTMACLLIAYFFIQGNGIFNINTCRFWTASWIAIYCNFQIFLNGNKKFLVLAFITPFIHLSYWFYLMMLALILLSSRYTYFWKGALLVSFIASNVAMQFVTDMSSYLHPSLQFMVETYINDVDTRGNLYQVLRRLFSLVENGYLLYILILFMRAERCIYQHPVAKKIYQFVLVWISVMFFLMPVPSLGSRFILLAMPMIAYLWLVVFEANGLHRRIIISFPIFFIMKIYQEFNVYAFHSVNYDFWITSPLYQVYKYLILGIE